MNVNSNNQTQTTTVQYRSHSLAKHAGKPGTAARARRKERRECKRWEQTQVKGAQVLRYAQYLFFHTMVWEAWEELCYAQEGMHYVQLGIVQVQVMKLKLEAVLQVGKSSTPTRMEKLWKALNTPLNEEVLGSLAYGVGMAAIATATTAVMWLPPDHKPHSFGERKQDPTLVRFLTELRKAHNSVQR